MKDFLSEEKGQGAFEYVLLVSGVMMVVATVVLVLRASIIPEVGSQVSDNAKDIKNLLNCSSANESCYK